MPRDEALADKDRVKYFEGTTRSLLAAIHEDGVDIRAYFPWSKYSSLLARICLMTSNQASLTTSNGRTAT